MTSRAKIAAVFAAACFFGSAGGAFAQEFPVQAEPYDCPPGTVQELVYECSRTTGACVFVGYSCG